MSSQDGELRKKLHAFTFFLRERLPQDADAEGQMRFADRILPPDHAYIKSTNEEEVSLEELRHRVEIYFFTVILGLSPDAKALRRWFAPTSLREQIVAQAVIAIEAVIDNEMRAPEHLLFEDMFRTARRLWKGESW